MLSQSEQRFGPVCVTDRQTDKHSYFRIYKVIMSKEKNHKKSLIGTLGQFDGLKLLSNI